MSKSVINTHAGDDSDGKLWGIEGINILFILAGLLLSVGLSLMLFRQQALIPGRREREMSEPGVQGEADSPESRSHED